MANKRGGSRRQERNRRAAARAAKFVKGKSAGKRGKSVNAPKGIW